MRKKDMRPYRPYGGRRRHPVLVVILCLVLLAAVAFGALQGYIALHSRDRLVGEPQVMVIFGCQMKENGPSLVLRDRLDTALAYLADHPDMAVVVSGGKGGNDHVSEAQGMYDYLTAHGVDGAHIYREDRSFNTWQNINNTFALMDEVNAARGLAPGDAGALDPGGEVLLVSSGFHLARIRMLWVRAGGQGDNISTLAAPVSHGPSVVQMFFREPLALVKSFLFDR